MHMQTNVQSTSESVKDSISPALEDESRSNMHDSDDDAPTVSTL